MYKCKNCGWTSIKQAGHFVPDAATKDAEVTIGSNELKKLKEAAVEAAEFRLDTLGFLPSIKTKACTCEILREQRGNKDYVCLSCRVIDRWLKNYGGVK